MSMSDNPEALHAAVCQAVTIANTSPDIARSADGRRISNILRSALVEYADAALAQQAATPAPAGWKLVPVEPTPEMVAAGCPAGESVDHYDMATAYRAMLAAQPATPAAQPAEEVVQRLMGLTDRFASACVQRGVAARAGGATEVAGQNLVTIRAALESALRAALAARGAA